jgi:hypothetical protein
MTEYNPYGARHFLREIDGEGASELRIRPVPLAAGGSAEKGEWVDTDRIATAALLEYPTLVVRRSPVRSRPPSSYRLVRSGRYYEVWQRPSGYPESVPRRLPLGDPTSPTAVPKCPDVAALSRLGRLEGHGAHLIAAKHAPVYGATNGSLRVPAATQYVAWLRGSVRGSVALLVDGKKVGEARQQLEEDGGFVELGQISLAAGFHDVELRFGGADLHPGSGGFPRPEAGPLLFSPAREEGGKLVALPLPEADRLCGRPWDWIEVVG